MRKFSSGWKEQKKNNGVRIMEGWAMSQLCASLFQRKIATLAKSVVLFLEQLDLGMSQREEKNKKARSGESGWENESIGCTEDIEIRPLKKNKKKHIDLITLNDSHFYTIQ